MTEPLDENRLEIVTLEYFQALGYEYVHGPSIAPDGDAPERANYGQVVLLGRLRNALRRINPGMPDEVIEDAIRQVTRTDSPDLIVNNRAFHRMLTDGVDVSWRDGGRVRHGKVWLFQRDTAKIDQNEFLVVNQFTVAENRRTRRPDVVVFVNGLPLAIIELKNPAEEKATIRHAFNQLQTYKMDIPGVFVFNEMLVISDGFAAKAGTLTSGWDRFQPWRTIDGTNAFHLPSPRPGGHPSPTGRGAGGEGGEAKPALEVLVKGIFEKQRFLDFVLNFITFEDDGKMIAKKAAAYHQYWAVNKAVACTVEASQPGGDRRIGVVWHTQGSGKSLSMAFYGGKIIKHPAMENPTLVVITDRNDLDDQLFGTFSTNSELLRQKPVQAESRDHLKELLRVASGGVVFTTLQKFMPSATAPSPQPSPRGRGSEGNKDYRGGFEFSGLVDRARKLRQQQTQAEEVLWQILRDRQFAGQKFRRQHQIGDYIVDFYCDDLKLVVELDGGVHEKSSQALKDTRRQGWLEEMGFRVIRFTNHAVLDNTESVLAAIAAYLPSTSGRGAGGEGPLSQRRNIVVIADEAHRSHYGFSAKMNRKTGEMKYGMAKYLRDALPGASFIGFTGTPVELDDKNTPAVFGDYIDKYDILRAVEDGSTVPIYYESRLAKLELKEDEKPKLDPEFEEITEGEEETEKNKLKTKWAALEAMVGTEKRVRLVAQDVIDHFEKRLDAMDGKAMIVCMSRRICVEIYDAIIKLRPQWHSADDAKGQIKIVMSGSASDKTAWQPHIRTKLASEAIAKRFKAPSDGLKLVIVRDMWLTGFDCPSMHTMYLDKPMNGHNLMQAIARVNRVFKDKPGGLVVDYLGIADALKHALHTYTTSGGKGQATVDQEQAAAVMVEKYEVVCGLLHGFDFKAILKAAPAQRMSGVAQAMEFVLTLDDGKTRYVQAVGDLSKAFALAVPHPQAMAIRDEIGLFQEIRSALIKVTMSESEKSPDDMESAIRQLVSRAVYSTEVVDIFAAAGLEKPDISILSDEFLADVQRLPQRNLALELLKKLINDEIKTRMRKNVVQARSFADMLEQAVRKYQNRALEAAQVIDELIRIAKEMRLAESRGQEMGLSDDEVAFYDALAENASAKQVIGDEKLRFLAQELVDRVKLSVTIDWQARENARAHIRVLVKRVLRKYGYPPDMQARATDLVLEQAEVLCKDWSTDSE